MERTIYSKYSNERAKRFCIRTDIVEDDAGTKKVYKHALTKEGRAHIEGIAVSCRKLNEAYWTSDISFCPCELGDEMKESVCVEFPFLDGAALQDVLQQATDAGEEKEAERILNEYICRVSRDGGEVSFVVTEEFEEVFGTLSKEACEILANGGKNAKTSALISDIDMIFSNLFVEREEAMMPDAKWQVIDYEWTFDFPIPKGFLIYRALYFAYYQLLCHAGFTLPELLAMAEITEDEAKIYQSMEEHFQKYMGSGCLPVRNMQRAMGTRIVTLEELLAGAGGAKNTGNAQIPEEKWLHVRKLKYQIDRVEYQDGSHVCSGWAFANTWDGIYYPVNIQVAKHDGTPIAAEIIRRERRDVAEVFDIRRVSDPAWGFDCVWIAPPDEEWELHFSLGKKECIYHSVRQ